MGLPPGTPLTHHRCYYPAMEKRLLLSVAAGLVVLLLASSLHAQSASAVFNGPQNMDAGLQNGLNNLTGYVALLSSNAKMLETKRFRLSEGDQNHG